MTPRPRIALIGLGGTIASLGREALDLVNYGDTGAIMHADDLAARPTLTRLLAVLHNTLEQNVEVMSAQDFVDWLRERALATGRLIEEHCAAFEPGDGPVFLPAHLYGALVLPIVAPAQPDLKYPRAPAAVLEDQQVLRPIFIPIQLGRRIANQSRAHRAGGDFIELHHERTDEHRQDISDHNDVGPFAQRG